MPNEIMLAAQAFADAKLKPLLDEFIRTGSDAAFTKIMLRKSLPIQPDDQKEVTELHQSLQRKLEQKDLPENELTSAELVVVGMSYRATQPTLALASLSQANVKSKKGDSFALFILALMYLSENGVEQDLQKALDYLNDAKKHCSMANVYLAVMYAVDGLVVKSIRIQAYCLALAVKAGNPLALYKQGLLYLVGSKEDKIKQDFKLAYQNFAEAAKQGEVRALVELGKMHFYGQGMPQNRKLAIEYFELESKLCGSSSSIAQGELNFKFELFLEQLTSVESFGAKRGTCFGYVTMMIIALASRQKENFFKRLTDWTGTSYSDIEKMSQLYSAFQATLKELPPLVADEKAVVTTLDKDQYVQKIYQRMNLDNSSRKQLDFLRELYVFIHALLFAQTHARILKKTNGEDLPWVPLGFSLPVILPDVLAEKGYYLQPPFLLEFHLTQAELSTVIKKTFFPGDIVAIGSHTHIVLFTDEGNQYFFYDPNNSSSRDKSVIFANIDQLATEIRRTLFVNLYLPAAYMPIHMQIIRFDAAPCARPSAASIVQDVLATREPDYGIHMLDWTRRSSLHLAVDAEDKIMLQDLLEQKVDPTPTFLATMTENRNIEVMRLLIKYIPDINVNQYSLYARRPIEEAALEGRIDVVLVLLESGATYTFTADIMLARKMKIQDHHWESIVTSLLNLERLPYFLVARLGKILKGNLKEIIQIFQAIVQKQPDDAARLKIIDSLLNKKNALRSYLEAFSKEAFQPARFFNVCAVKEKPARANFFYQEPMIDGDENLLKYMRECVRPFRDLMEYAKTYVREGYIPLAHAF